jgi:hypothetical protein
VPDTPPVPVALADLVLARLLPPAKKPPGPGKVQTDIAPLLREPPVKDVVKTLAKTLKADGLIADPGLTLTDAGRERALAFLRIKELPAKATWGTIRDKYLLPLALGLTVEEGERLSKAPALAGYLLRKKFALASPAGGKNPVDAAVAALVCRLVGFPNCTTFDDLAAAAVSKELNAKPPLTAEQYKTQRVRLLLGTKGEKVGDLRTKVLPGAFGTAGEPTKPAASESPDLRAFAGRVLAAARACKTGRFGDRKVFISHVWKALAGDPAVQGIDLDGFKRKLVECNRTGLLHLLQGNLTQAFDRKDMDESETIQHPSAFHFIDIGDAQ